MFGNRFQQEYGYNKLRIANRRQCDSGFGDVARCQRSFNKQPVSSMVSSHQQEQIVDQKSISVWVNTQPRHREINTTIDSENFEHQESIRDITCPICLDVPRFPIIFRCKHFLCSFCYKEHFRTNKFKQDGIGKMPCPMCRANVSSHDAFTFSDSILFKIKSNFIESYNTIHYKCDNIGCNKLVKLCDLNDHEMCDCSFRMLKCHFRHCLIIGTAEQMITFRQNTPYQYTNIPEQKL